jgi:predicted nucleic acid-binding Zn ribbon protein
MASPKADSRVPLSAERTGQIKVDNSELRSTGILARPSLASPRRGPQLSCEYCGKRFPKKSKRPQHCCSSRCRKALSRERSRFNPLQVLRPQTSRCSPKSANDTKGCKSQMADLHRRQVVLPVSILGARFQWPSPKALEPSLLQKIIRAEIGGTLHRAGGLS